ncbi:MAG: hypothetical protein IPP93_04995 [Chitinophagaceae bacterium]|nr:hypothetical protein [Chitinophagaceae bacterium]
MKKIFLVLGIAIAGSAMGQQKDLFNVDEYLKKQKIPSYIRPADTVFVYNPANPAPKSLLKSFDLPNGNRVSFLPQDNMPCVVPKMEDYSINVQGYPAIQPMQKPVDPVLPRRIIPIW